MSKVYNNRIITSAGFQYNSDEPIDDRLVVETYDDLSSLNRYEGMIVYVKDKDTYYKYTKETWNVFNNGDHSIVSNISNKGSISVNDVSLVEHEVKVQLSGKKDNSDYSSVSITSSGNLLPYPYTDFLKTNIVKSYAGTMDIKYNNDGSLTLNGFTGNGAGGMVKLGMVRLYKDREYHLNIKELPKGTSYQLVYYDSIGKRPGMSEYFNDGYTGNKILQETERDDIYVEISFAIPFNITANNVTFTPKITTTQTIAANYNGSVDGLLSIGPKMELVCDNPDVTIDLTYFNKNYAVFENDYNKSLINNICENNIKNKPGLKIDNGGEIFNDYENNQALNPYSHTEGLNNISSSKSYKIIDFELTDGTNPNLIIEGDATALFDDITESMQKYSLEKSISLKFNNKNYDFYCNIRTIIPGDNTLVFVTELPNDIEKSDLPGVLWVPTNPEKGIDVIGEATHTEGRENKAIEDYSHAEGYLNISAGKYSHTEGMGNIALHAAHAEGINTKAIGEASHTGGISTNANQVAQTAIGKFNNNKETTLFEIGNGIDDANRSNAFEVYNDGHGELQTQGTSDNSIVINKTLIDELNKVNEKVAILESTIQKILNMVQSNNSNNGIVGLVEQNTVLLLENKFIAEVEA